MEIDRDINISCLWAQNAFQSVRITFWPTMCFWPYIVDFAQNYFQMVEYGPITLLVSLVTRLHWNWQRYQHFLFMSAKCFSERKNQFLTNNVFLTLYYWFSSKLTAFQCVRITFWSLPNGGVWPFNPLVSLVTFE